MTALRYRPKGLLRIDRIYIGPVPGSGLRSQLKTKDRGKEKTLGRKTQGVRESDSRRTRYVTSSRS